MSIKEGPKQFESVNMEERYRSFLAAYFEAEKNSIIRFINWIINVNTRYYAHELKRKNQRPEQVVEDILQNMFVSLLGQTPETKEKIMQGDLDLRRVIMNNQVRWAVNGYFNWPGSAGLAQSRSEYPVSRDVFERKGLELLNLKQFNETGKPPDEDELQPGTEAALKDYLMLPTSESNPYILAEKQELKERLNEMLKSLKSRKQEEVLRMRFGLYPYNREYTLQEIAIQEGCSREWVRKIEYKALKYIRHPRRAKKLQGFIVSPFA